MGQSGAMCAVRLRQAFVGLNEQIAIERSEIAGQRLCAIEPFLYTTGKLVVIIASPKGKVERTDNDGQDRGNGMP